MSFVSKLVLALLVTPLLVNPAAAAEGQAAKLVLLGSKGGPSIRNLDRMPTSHVLVVGGAAYVIDTGYGVVQRLVKAGIPLPSVRRIFITHHHSDHNLDYGSLLYNAWANGLKTGVDAYGPPGLEELTRGVWQANRFDIETRMADEGRPDLRKLVTTHEIKEGMVFQDGDLKVTALRVHHPPIKDAFAYRFEVAGKTVVFSGDTSYLPALAEFAKGADILVHEAMYKPGIEALARRNTNAAHLLEHLQASHTVAEDVGRIAQAAGVRTLVLSHLVPGDDGGITDDHWRRAAATTYGGKILVAADGMEIPLGR